jgi:hypothetical protein
MDKAYGKWNWTLMPDGASAHTAQATQESLSLFCHLLEGWLSRSPDLNPIENLWGIMNARIAAVGANTLEDLAEVITTVWVSITPEEVAALVQSRPKTLLATVPRTASTLAIAHLS